MITLFENQKSSCPLSVDLCGAHVDFISVDDLALTNQSELSLALTLTLSPRRGNPQWPRRKSSQTDEPFPAQDKILPLPGREGRGEGGREFQLNTSSLMQNGRVSSPCYDLADFNNLS